MYGLHLADVLGPVYAVLASICLSGEYMLIWPVYADLASGPGAPGEDFGGIPGAPGEDFGGFLVNL